jgi:thiamine biosynthesis lipoprotein
VPVFFESFCPEMKGKLDILFGLLLGLALLAALWWVTNQNRPPVTENSGFRPIMGTLAQVTVVAPDSGCARVCILAAFEAMERVQQSMNDRNPDSELSRLSQTAFGQAVPVSPGLFAVLCAARQYSQLSGGAFDITVGPEVALWREMEKTGIRPRPEQIEEAREKVGYEKVILNLQDQTVRFEKEGMRLDLGGIAKGYAVDLAVEAIRQNGALGGMVDIGGNIRCFGQPPAPAKDWIIGLQNPRAETVLKRIKLNDFAVATSGDYRRYAQAGGRRYSHILNPSTGDSAEELISVTIVAPTAMEADALSTAVSVMGRQRGLDLIESLDGIEAILITADRPDELIQTSRAEDYLLD